jgi:hypothetical protein
MPDRRKANIDGDVEQITKSMADGIKEFFHSGLVAGCGRMTGNAETYS